MNIEKIKNYNQKILALVGTLGVVLLVIFIIMMIPELLRTFYRGHYDNTPSGLLADDKVGSLNQENLRKQLISYESPWLIDTLNTVYIIPVSIQTLKKAEEVPVADEALMSLMDTYSDFTVSKKGYHNTRQFEGNYANLILYKPSENKTQSLFNERIMIGNVQAYYFKDDILLVFYSAEKDTNKDGIIGLNDTRNLCLYSLNKGTLKKISDSDNSVEDYQFIENSKDLLVEFQLKQYKDSQFKNSRIPGKIMKYGYDSQELTDIIPQKIQEDMQKLVEGK
ncbi:MAG: hypothetical protein EZS26_001027 [Candidatus Ordinivivax streblomastigis]|uniref:Uncharacterized protein n=1 Tax=Candidatus Ordinivivax streblomastigis TaxID=2540710 RepID=A0A5M8P2Z7_9BACT|nr:MAG: hypothetical protein EZS26_001027 [Candidatus Ordinivivax streblomastigis]